MSQHSRRNFLFVSSGAAAGTMLVRHPVNGKLYNVVSDEHAQGILWMAVPLDVLDVDDDMILVGIITEKDVLRLLIEVDPDTRVRDYMTTDVKTFEETASVLDICAHLFLSDIKRVPIVSGDKLVGIVGRRDVIREILRLRGRS